MKTTFRTLPRPEASGRSRLTSVGAAALVHAAAIAAALSIEGTIVPRAGADGWAFAPGAEGDAASRAAGGGGGEVILQLPPPPPADAAPDLPAVPDLVAPDVPAITPELPAVTLDPIACTDACSITPPTLPGSGGGSGGGAGPGVGAGTGPSSGNGGSGGGGGGTGIRPPAPMTILVPPQATAAVRGKAATVRLQIDSLGTVRDAQVIASSGDEGYDAKLRNVAMGWRFRPARDASNRPIAYPFDVSLRF